MLPLPKVFGQQWSLLPGLTGFEMTASAVDPEDGALSGAAFFWVVDGDVDFLSGETVCGGGRGHAPSIMGHRQFGPNGKPIRCGSGG